MTPTSGGSTPGASPRGHRGAGCSGRCASGSDDVEQRCAVARTLVALLVGQVEPEHRAPVWLSSSTSCCICASWHSSSAGSPRLRHSVARQHAVGGVGGTGRDDHHVGCEVLQVVGHCGDGRCRSRSGRWARPRSRKRRLPPRVTGQPVWRVGVDDDARRGAAGPSRTGRWRSTCRSSRPPRRRAAGCGTAVRPARRRDRRRRGLLREARHLAQRLLRDAVGAVGPTRVLPSATTTAARERGSPGSRHDRSPRRSRMGRSMNTNDRSAITSVTATRTTNSGHWARPVRCWREHEEDRPVEQVDAVADQPERPQRRPREEAVDGSGHHAARTSDHAREAEQRRVRRPSRATSSRTSPT